MNKQIQTLEPNKNSITQLDQFGLLIERSHIRLHLGCGEQYFKEYINIDYPPDEHNVMQPVADVYANVITLEFPTDTVDEIRSHHMFEHFNRVVALSQLIKWHDWLRVGGRIVIETPDIIGCAKTLLSDVSYKTKSSIIRHLAGDQSASWAYHVDHWSTERFQHTLALLGFTSIETHETTQPHEPFLSNVIAVATKEKNIPISEKIKQAELILWDSAISEAEKPTYNIWRNQLHALFDTASPQSPSVVAEEISNIAHEPILRIKQKPEMTIHEIWNFNQKERDNWMKNKASSLKPGSKVLDVGAGTCPYKPLFSHCDYSSQDFKQYVGEKLGGTTEYGQIDYVSDIENIPVEDGTFDVIVCTEVLEHTREPVKAFQEMVRILRPGGRLLLTAPLGSGLHQLPYHYYGGFTPEFYKFYCEQCNLTINELSPNGGLFRLLAQENARIAWTIAEHSNLQDQNSGFVSYLFGEWIPRFLFAQEEKQFVEGFTVGYHLDAIKNQTK